MRPTARNRYAAVGTTTVSDNEWHHLAGVFINNTNRILYVDGIPEATLAQDVAFFPEIDRCSAGLCDKVAPWSDQWQGGIDDVRVYNETLSQADILAFMAGDGDTQPPDPNEDLDGDGLPDNWEIFYFGSTNAPEGDRDGHADTDGASNWEEYTAGTDPTNATSCLSLAISLSNSCIAVSFPAFTASGLGYSVLNRFYDIEHLGTMHGSWQPLDGATNIPGDNSTVTYTNSFTPAEFFRATTVLQ